MSYRYIDTPGSPHTPSTLKSDQSSEPNSNRLSYPFKSTSNYRHSSNRPEVSSYVDFPACRSPRSNDFKPIKAWNALTSGHRKFPGCSAASPHPELKDFEWLPQRLVDMGWFRRELQLLNTLLTKVNSFRRDPYSPTLYSVNRDMLNDLDELLEERFLVTQDAGALPKDSTLTTWSLPNWGRGEDDITESRWLTAEEFGILAAWFRWDVECILHYLAYCFVHSIECSCSVRIRSKNEKWFQTSDLRPPQHSPQSITTSILSAQSHSAESLRSDRVETLQTPMMTTTSGTRVSAPSTVGLSPLRPHRSHSPPPHLISNPKPLSAMRCVESLTPATVVTPTLISSHYPVPHASSRTGSPGLPPLKYTSWASRTTTTLSPDGQAPVVDACSHAPNHRELFASHHRVPELPPSDPPHLRIVDSARSKSPVVRLLKTDTQPPPFEVPNSVTARLEGLQEVSSTVTWVCNTSTLSMRNEAHSSPPTSVSNPLEFVAGLKTLSPTRQSDPIPCDRTRDETPKLSDSTIEKGCEGSDATDEDGREIPEGNGTQNQYVSDEEVTDVTFTSPAPVYDSLTSKSSRLHPTICAPPHVGSLRPPKLERTSWDSHKTETPKVDEEAPAANAHSHASTQREPAIHHVFVDKPPLVRASFLNLLNHPEGPKPPLEQMQVTNRRFWPFKMVSKGIMSQEDLQRFIPNENLVRVTDSCLLDDETHQFANLNHSDPQAALSTCASPTQSRSMSIIHTRLCDASYPREREDTMDHGCVGSEARDDSLEEIAEEVSKQNQRVLREDKSDTTTNRTVVMDGSPSNRASIAPSTPLSPSWSPIPCVITPTNMHSTAFRALPDYVIMFSGTLERDLSTGSLVRGTPHPTYRKTHPSSSHEVADPTAFLPGPKTPNMMRRSDRIPHNQTCNSTCESFGSVRNKDSADPQYAAEVLSKGLKESLDDVGEQKQYVLDKESPDIRTGSSATTDAFASSDPETSLHRDAVLAPAADISLNQCRLNQVFKDRTSSMSPRAIKPCQLSQSLLMATRPNLPFNNDTGGMILLEVGVSTEDSSLTSEEIHDSSLHSTVSSRHPSESIGGSRSIPSTCPSDGTSSKRTNFADQSDPCNLLLLPRNSEPEYPMTSECAGFTATDANHKGILDNNGKLNRQVLHEDTDDAIPCRTDFMDDLPSASLTACTRPLIPSPSDSSDAHAISQWKCTDSLECPSSKRNSGGGTLLDDIKESLPVKRCISSASRRFHSTLSCAVSNTLLVGSKSGTVLRFAPKRPDPSVVPPQPRTGQFNHSSMGKSTSTDSQKSDEAHRLEAGNAVIQQSPPSPNGDLQSLPFKATQTSVLMEDYQTTAPNNTFPFRVSEFVAAHTSGTERNTYVFNPLTDSSWAANNVLDAVQNAKHINTYLNVTCYVKPPHSTSIRLSADCLASAQQSSNSIVMHNIKSLHSTTCPFQNLVLYEDLANVMSNNLAATLPPPKFTSYSHEVDSQWTLPTIRQSHLISGDQTHKVVCKSFDSTMGKYHDGVLETDSGKQSHYVMGTETSETPATSLNGLQNWNSKPSILGTACRLAATLTVDRSFVKLLLGSITADRLDLHTLSLQQSEHQSVFNDVMDLALIDSQMISQSYNQTSEKVDMQAHHAPHSRVPNMIFDKFLNQILPQSSAARYEVPTIVEPLNADALRNAHSELSPNCKSVAVLQFNNKTILKPFTDPSRTGPGHDCMNATLNLDEVSVHSDAPGNVKIPDEAPLSLLLEFTSPKESIAPALAICRNSNLEHIDSGGEILMETIPSPSHRLYHGIAFMEVYDSDASVKTHQLRVLYHQSSDSEHKTAMTFNPVKHLAFLEDDNDDPNAVQDVHFTSTFSKVVCHVEPLNRTVTNKNFLSSPRESRAPSPAYSIDHCAVLECVDSRVETFREITDGVGFRCVSFWSPSLTSISTSSSQLSSAYHGNCCCAKPEEMEKDLKNKPGVQGIQSQDLRCEETFNVTYIRLIPMNTCAKIPSNSTALLASEVSDHHPSATIVRPIQHHDYLVSRDGLAEHQSNKMLILHSRMFSVHLRDCIAYSPSVLTNVDSMITLACQPPSGLIRHDNLIEVGYTEGKEILKSSEQNLVDEGMHFEPAFHSRPPDRNFDNNNARTPSSWCSSPMTSSTCLQERNNTFSHFHLSSFNTDNGQPHDFSSHPSIDFGCSDTCQEIHKGYLILQNTSVEASSTLHPKISNTIVASPLWCRRYHQLVARNTQVLTCPEPSDPYVFVLNEVCQLHHQSCKLQSNHTNLLNPFMHPSGGEAEYSDRFHLPMDILSLTTQEGCVKSRGQGGICYGTAHTMIFA